MSAQPTFLRSLLTLFTGTVIAQGIPFLLAPVIARQYSAEQFAVFGTLMAVFSILNVVSAARYEMAVVLPFEDRESAHLVRGALIIAAITGVLSFLLMWVFGSSSHLAHRLPGLSSVSWVVAVLTCLAGTQLALQQWLLRRKRFDAVARVKVTQAVVVTLATIALGYAGVRNGLAIGYLIGWICFTTATIWWVLRREPLPVGWTMPHVRGALHRYREWPLVNTWPALINAVASGMATFYMAAYFAPDIAGQHNFARQYMLVPISMVTVALGQILFVRSAERVRERKPLMPELIRVLRALVIAAVVMIGVIVVFGQPLFRWLFGEHWAFAGSASRFLIWGYAAQLVASPFGIVLLALRRVKMTLVFPVVFILLLMIPPLFRSWAPLHFIALLGGIEAIAYSMQVALVFWCVARYDRSLSA